MDWTTLVLTTIGLLIFSIFSAFSWLSHKEGESRAMKISLGLGLLSAGFYISAAALPEVFRITTITLTTVLGLAVIVLFFAPIGRVAVTTDIPSSRFDEREIMFARARLQPGTPEYQDYYAKNPEHKIKDDRFRVRPGLLSPEAKYYDRFHAAPPDASFFLTEAMRDLVDGAVLNNVVNRSPKALTAYIKGLAYYFGALDVGITNLQPHHVYSHIGRGAGNYGAPIDMEHRFAIAFTVEMDFAMTGTAPYAPVTMESAKQYVESARVAIQLAKVIRSLGYAARAHIDGNYQVIAPLVARDAGLGEIGRMGLLMTPRQGPRVRIGVVTTELALTPDSRQQNTAVIDFCNICKKCAANCPSKSISFDQRVEIDSALRWRIDPDTCFLYWNSIGTDCGRCLAVCPYAHPDNWAHNFVRWGIAHSGFFRRVAVWLDDLFYSREPVARPAPDWSILV